MKIDRITRRNSIALAILAALLSGCLEKVNVISASPQSTTTDSTPTDSTPGDSSPNDSQGNAAPQIWGNPDSAITAGDSYSFTPSAADPDGDVLTFSAQNLPAWATINPENGEISGQPVVGDEGTYGSIAISVSDGRANAALPAFTVTVTQAALGSATLSWTPPTENTDQTPLSDLSAYKLYFGKIRDRYTNQVYIDNPGMTTFVVGNLEPTTYYFVTTAINSAGAESSYSNVAVKTVQ